MTASTITAVAGNNFYSSGSKVLTLYNVQNEDIRKSAGVIDLPMPTLDSNGKIVMDLMGASREISIDGIVAISDVGTGNLFKYAQDIAGLSGTYNSLINGSQGTNQYSFFSQATSSSINVCITEASAKYEKGNPNSLTYSITMMEYGTLV
jgi:hypothetical protein